MTTKENNAVRKLVQSQYRTTGYKLKISDQKLNIKQQISDVPYKDLWPREVGFNMFQAMLSYLKQTSNLKLDRPVEMSVKGIVLKEFFETINTTAPKMCFYNLGGMSATDLEESSHIQSDVKGNGKDHGEDGCFGKGEKINLLNFTDVLKMSCKDGLAHYYIMTNNNGEAEVPNGIQPVDVEWLEKFKDELEVDLEHDWTLTILLGSPKDQFENYKHQNTVTHPHSPTGDREVGHLVKNLFQRLYDFPNDQINLVFVTHKTRKDMTPHNAGRNPGERMPFKTGSQIWESVKKAHPDCFDEIVEDELTGVKYHYIYDAPDKNKKPASTSRSQNMGNLNFMSLIHGPQGERERYDVQFVTGKWKGISSRFGIYSKDDEKFFRVDIELPKEQYKPYGNREGIKLRNEYGGDGKISRYEDFIDGAVLNKSKAVRWSRMVEEHKNKIEVLDLQKAILEKLDGYYDDLEHSGGPKTKSGNGKVYPPNTNPRPRPPRPNPSPSPAPRLPRGSSAPIVPQIIVNPMKTGSDNFAVFEELGEKGKPVIFVNPIHGAVNRVLNQVNFPDKYESNYRDLAVNHLGINLAVKILIAKSQRDRELLEHDKFKNEVEPASLNLKALFDTEAVDSIKSDHHLKAMRKEEEANKNLEQTLAKGKRLAVIQ